jgi:phosphatidylserine/phosphatidylglycerophosphate/cardiolipin synthase-like enzyme
MRRLVSGLLALLSTVTVAPSALAEGAAVAVQPATSQITLHVEPADGYRPLIEFIRSARQTLDYTIYEFNDARIARELKAAHRRGVDVRVIFTWQVFPAGSNLWDPTNPNYNTNMPTFNALAKAGIDVRLSPFTYTYSHQKSMVADGRTGRGRALIMDFNSQPSYLTPTQGLLGTRGFAITTTNQQDVREIQAFYDADWERRQPPAPTSPRLAWSPNGVGYQPATYGKERIFTLIDGATSTLDLYVLLLDYLPFQDRVIAAARRGVDVRIITNTDPPAMTFDQVEQLAAAGVEFGFDPTYPAGPIFVHSKAMIRDAGTANAMAFVGSQNPGDNVSTNSERELGILIGKASIIDRMARVFERDWKHVSPLTYQDGQPKDPYWTYRAAAQ